MRYGLKSSTTETVMALCQEAIVETGRDVRLSQITGFGANREPSVRPFERIVSHL